MPLTAGLVYPFMSANLWSYRYRHSWYGDRQFGFSGSWKQLARPFYLSYIAIAAIGGVGLIMGSAMGAMPISGAPDPSGFVPIGLAAALIGIVLQVYRSRELTRMYSSVRLGEASLTIHVRARSLIAQYGLFGLALLGSYIVLAIGGIVVLGAIASEAFAGGSFDIENFMQHMQGSLVTLVAIVLGYLLILAAFTLMAELFLGLGFWKLIASNATVTGLASLGSVRARDEDRALAGEGLADALNVGAY